MIERRDLLGRAAPLLAMLIASCGGAPAPGSAPSATTASSAPNATVSAAASNAPASSAPSASASAESPPAPSASAAPAASAAPRKPAGKLPKGAVTKPLSLSVSVEPLFGLTVTLLERTHKELAGPPPLVIGVWTVEINRNKKTVTTGLSGDTLYLEGSGLAATWIIEGPYDREQITVWPGETKPIDGEQAIALARAELAASGPLGEPARVLTTEGGAARIAFGKGQKATRVRVGLYSKRVMVLGPDE
ncbi:MAG: hypothetical protein U0359_33995 [Byssovorax sp.]